jgi:hypothetical protein
MTLRATHAYIGIRDDGAVRAFIYDDPGEEEDTASVIEEWRLMGRRFERLPASEALHRFLVGRVHGEKAG